MRPPPGGEQYALERARGQRDGMSVASRFGPTVMKMQDQGGIDCAFGKELAKVVGMLKVKLITRQRWCAEYRADHPCLEIAQQLLSKVQTMINRLFLAVLLLCVESCR